MKLPSEKSGGSFFCLFFIFTICMSKDYKITSQGSLGILALGHIGLRLWREKAKQEQTKQLELKDDQKQKK